MRKTLLLFLILPLWASAQVFDDFSDGDFTHEPAWTGTDTSFIVNASHQLQSAATVAGESWLVVAGGARAARNNVEWRFWIRENFSPSANNYADVWLSADTTALPLATQGYFLRFGAPGSLDAIELYRKDHDGEHMICKGADAAIASSFKKAVKVSRDAEGHWTLTTDSDNVGNYTIEAEGYDNTLPADGCFGFHLHFTASNARKFFFDDVYIGPAIVDTEPPVLLTLEPLDAHHLLLTFNEPLDASALDPQHFQIHQSDRPASRQGEANSPASRHCERSEAIQPDSVCFNTTPSSLLLSFTNALPENTNLTLHIDGITDLAGNVMPPTDLPFSIYHPAENDVVINEIMADPSPVVGLPEWEYVELFNTTHLTINLNQWSFLIGNTRKTLPAVAIAPQGYLILCKADAEPELQAFGPTCGFSSFTIANAGATLRLLSPDETTVSEVSFTDNWYHDADKRNGGWSLEQIDPFNPCAGTVNWSASTDPSGGTPGRENAINAPNETIPSVARINVLGDNMVLLWFDQQMDRSSLQNPEQYLIEELNIHPVEVLLNPVESSSLNLMFDCHFVEGVLYTLTLNGMTSCSGQPIEPDTRVTFGIPNAIGPGEVVINEILFDPISPGVDYVELYNRSDKTFDLSELKLGVVRETFPSPADTTLKTVSDESRLFMPGSYLLLSTDGYTVCQQYQCEPANYFDMASFPSFANAGGIALLMSRQGVVVDQMAFSEKMHYPLLKVTKGVSLERVSFDAPSDQADNWHSAAETAHFGTPGCPNSMRDKPHETPQENPIEVLPSVFSPDGDGYDDNCQVSYRLDGSGYSMNAYVFSADGRLVRHLVRGELVTDEGKFVWNGLDGQGNRVPIGIYVVVTEVFNTEGNVKRFKNAVAVASR